MSQIQPEGEELRKAIKWISDNLNEGKKKNGRRGVHAHNAFLQQSAELGVVGGLLFSAVWAAGLFWGYSRARSSIRLAPVAILGCLLALLVQNVGENLLSSLDGARGRLTTLVWIALAMATAGSRPAHPTSEEIGQQTDSL